ncbi:hypothetical protein D4L85_18965 [Chryseolinea soli]|uniref:Uncharacterized protein n=1 Tax=Chryseolinea soli TaxID=2321403 RepID=A0A385SMW4_9BACT|nr:hypothetical protein D4L85_18965 [Chryseolinea soli]
MFGCHKDDDVTAPHTILTLQVDTAYPVTADNWIFATNDGGEVLDVKSYTAGETVTLVSDKAGDKINVTFFNRRESPFETNSFVTYADVPGGTVLRLAASASSSQELEQGAVKFKISNYYYGSCTVDFSNTGTGTGSVGSGMLDMDFSFYGPSDIFMSGYRKGVPVYNWAKAVKNGDVVMRDFDADFVAFPHQRKLDFTGTNHGIIYGIDADGNYLTILDTYQLLGTTYKTDQPVIGYIDGFVSYDMTVSSDKSNGQISYQSIGALDLSFTMPTAFNFSLQSNGMRDLSFSFSEDYTYYMSAWAYTQDSENIRWYFEAPPGVSVKGMSLPSEIAAKYPQIDVSKFKHTSIGFTKIIEGGSYLENILGATAVSDPKTLKKYTYSPKL